MQEESAWKWLIIFAAIATLALGLIALMVYFGMTHMPSQEPPGGLRNLTIYADACSGRACELLLKVRDS